MRLTIRPLTLKQANAAIQAWHRHHAPVRGHRFSIGCYGEDGACVGVCVVGRPVARLVPQYEVAEVTRLATDGTRNACSALYAAAARACEAMGFVSIQTYTLPEEGGSSLRGAGWVCEGEAGGGGWNRATRERRRDQPEQPKLRWRKTFRAISHAPRTLPITRNVD